ncbi:MAG: Stp1/IreP family PP2C-type Ser/Thr phosphatase [bacterium]|nr:Stp1/IreP family PP2C-type Ser/Thr phosphatase [bacterium]
MKLESSSLSHIGQVRQKNEDATGFSRPSGSKEREQKGTIFVVADGMGGHRGGEIASKLAVDTIISTYYTSRHDDPCEALAAAFKKANKIILQKAVGDAELFGMGTTCTTMVTIGSNAYFAHVGDSRAYVLRGGKFEQITEDHSLVGEMVRSGILSNEDAQHHPKRNVITRSLGTHEELEADCPLSPFKMSVGDVFLLCSDGLTSLVPDEEVAETLSSGSTKNMCATLVDLANDKGGKDNITVQVIKVVS